MKVLAARVLPNAPNALLGALDTKYPCLALLTTDCDDATYIALDEATKAARAEVVYGRSCYAGADNATQGCKMIFSILCAPPGIPMWSAASEAAPKSI